MLAPRLVQEFSSIILGPFLSDWFFLANGKQPRLAEPLQDEFSSMTGNIPFRPAFCASGKCQRQRTSRAYYMGIVAFCAKKLMISDDLM